MHLSIIASSPSLELSGANVLVANLLDQLHQAGLRTEWIVTGHNPADDASWLGTRRFKVHRLPPTKISNVRERQRLLLEFLEERAPCVYLPNFDFDMACAAPALSPANKAVLIMHCDDPVYYDFAARHGNLFNAVVSVSKHLAKKLSSKNPELRERIIYIPFGVEPPAELPVRENLPGRPLEVAYCGRISFHQKRVQDLAAIIVQSYEENLPLKFHIAGTGPDENEFFARVRGPVQAGVVSRLGFLPNAGILKLLQRMDVLLMTSDFEGLPVILLEAMSRGCAPVITETESGASEVVQHGGNGFLLPIGDVRGFVAILKRLSADTALLSRLQAAAFERIRSDGFTLERAAADYRKLFESLPVTGRLERNGAAITPEHYLVHRRIFRRLKTFAAGVQAGHPFKP